jgi:hypothetical protein
MNCSTYLTVMLAALLVAGCSTPTKVDKGPIHASTFNFINGGSRVAPGFVDNREQVHATIQDAITQNLASKGLSRVPSGGDLTVAYLIVVGNNGSTEAISTYFGYGREDAEELHEKAQSAYTGSNNPNYFEAGTLLIDIIDSKTNKLLKRSYVTRPLLRDRTADVRVEQIREAVNTALQDVQLSR